ncbi:MAG: type II toxin-antitoxin system HicB family antitoxin [Lachnospiraceae bacterium]|nr:type II toxin-antitoxin system HicB family antitoxin [Lachnospiraceae bacterium]
MAKYIYPAVFTPEAEGGYSVTFPDIEGCFTCGNDLEEALSMAKDALSLMLVDIEDEKGDIPKASEINSLKMKKNEFASLIFADTMVYRQTLNNAAVKKTLSIPAWLNQAAIAAGINFSQVLQDALRAQLNM